MSWDIFPKSKIQYFLEKLKTKLDLKVDKETGKGLSTNDFDNTYKSKVDKIDTTTTSASGNPISITGLKSDQLAIDPVLTFEPIQDLHGQSKPYPAGGGKNLIPLTLSAIQAASVNSAPTGSWSGNIWNSGAGVTVEVIYDSANNVSGLKVNGTATSNVIFHLSNNMTVNATAYTLSGCPSGGSAETYRMDARNMSSSISVDSGDGVTFTSEQRNDGYIVIRVQSGTSVSNRVFKPQLELGSSKTSFAPYSNICPISGYDKVEVGSCGKNLFDKNGILAGYRLSNAGVPESDASYCVSNFVRVKANTAYYVTATSNTRHWFYDAAQNPVTTIGSSSAFTYTPTADGYIRVSVYNYTDKLPTMQITQSSTAQTYEPHKSATSITESLGQTVYVGEWDLRSGKFKVTHKMVDMGALDYSYHATSSGVKIYATASLSDMLPTAGIHPFICECYDSVQTRGVDFTISKYNQYAENANLYVNDSRYSADAAGAAALKAALSGVKLVYQLATPITIQLTPHEISLLKSYAYVSTNGTNIALNYHNGEMASLGDVTQIAESMENAKNVLPYRLMEKDITAYNSSTNKYLFEFDGYVTITIPANGSGSIRVIIYSADNNTLGRYKDVGETEEKFYAIYVKKGMYAMVTNSITNATVIFRAIS